MSHTTRTKNREQRTKRARCPFVLCFLFFVLPSEADLDDRPPGAILEEADAVLDQAHIEAHLGLGLHHADAPDHLGLLAGEQFVLNARHPPLVGRAWGDRPAVGVALGRAAAVGVPVYADTPEAARLDGVLAACDRGEDV